MEIAFAHFRFPPLSSLTLATFASYVAVADPSAPFTDLRRLNQTDEGRKNDEARDLTPAFTKNCVARIL